MIPAKTKCTTSWTLEYHAYLMTERIVNQNNVAFECLYGNPECVTGIGVQNTEALSHYVMTTHDKRTTKEQQKNNKRTTKEQQQKK